MVFHTLLNIQKRSLNTNRRIKVKGSPNLQGLKTIMVGVRNPLKNDPNNIWQAG